MGHVHRHTPFSNKRRGHHFHRHLPSSRKENGVAMPLHNLPLRTSPSSSGQGKGWSWPHNRLFRSLAPSSRKGKVRKGERVALTTTPSLLQKRDGGHGHTSPSFEMEEVVVLSRPYQAPSGRWKGWWSWPYQTLFRNGRDGGLVLTKPSPFWRWRRWWP